MPRKLKSKCKEGRKYHDWRAGCLEDFCIVCWENRSVIEKRKKWGS